MKRLLLLLLFAFLVAGYTDRSFSVDMQLKPDGSAHVVEKAYFVLDNKNEVEAFEFVLKQGKSTLADWQKFSRNIRYHFIGSVDTKNLRIVAAREFGKGFTTASVTLEYNVFNVLLMNQTGSRTTHYSLNGDKLLLGSSPGDMTLGSNVVFTLFAPQNAIRLKVAPDAGATIEENTIKWIGPTSGRWDVSFDIEITLAQEVQEFFIGLFSLLSSSYLLWILLFFVLLVVGYKVFGLKR